MTDNSDQIPKRSLGLTLREIRKDRGLTQEDLAARADLNPTYISGIETGERNPSWATIEQILRVLERPVDEFGAIYEQVRRDQG